MIKLYMPSRVSPRQPLSSAGLNARSQWEQRALRLIGGAPVESTDATVLRRRNARITAAYASMYLRDPLVYRWAGMAALTSAAVGRGMYMMRYLRTSRLGGMLGLFNSEVDLLYRTLSRGNLAVFVDIYWQHLAYTQGGLAEISRIFRRGQLHPEAYAAWQRIDQGRRAGESGLIWEGNTTLLKFEQREVLQPCVYQGNDTLWNEVSGWIDSPIPGHLVTFEEFSRGGNLGNFEQRWAWIETSMLPSWMFLAERRPERVERRLRAYLNTESPLQLLGIALPRHRPAVPQTV